MFSALCMQEILFSMDTCAVYIYMYMFVYSTLENGTRLLIEKTVKKSFLIL